MRMRPSLSTDEEHPGRKGTSDFRGSRFASALPEKHPVHQFSAGSSRLSLIFLMSGLLAMGVIGWNLGWLSSVGLRTAMAANPVLQPVAEASYEKDLLPFIQKYCADCHGSDSPEGDFSLERYTDLEGIHRDRGIWVKLMKLVDLGSMPPSSADQPTPAERAHVVAWLNRQLFYVNCDEPRSPGRVTIRRLNRTEYNNTVNALLGIQFKPAENFPSDDVGHGFDNIADVLTVPPLLIEKYLSAAESIAAIAIQDRSPVYSHQLLTGSVWKNEGSVNNRGHQKVFVSRGKSTATTSVPRKGRYQLKIDARQDKGGNEDAIMLVRLNDEELKSVEVKKTRNLEQFEIPFDAPAAGQLTISIAFVNDFYDAKAKKNRDRNLHVGDVVLEGPLDLTEDEKKLPRLILAVPGTNLTVTQAATKNLEAFLPRAFRRPATPEEISRYVHIVERGTEDQLSFRESMGIALQAILISPDFLFRVEGGRRRVGDVELIDDFALASRLSYFLWSSCPDEELFDLARANRLHEPQILKAQTLRMLSDPRADELIANFSGQWLGLRKLSTSEVDPNPKQFPDFTAEVRHDLWKETELFFGSIVRENRSIFELLTGKYTFLNHRLAKFYGLEGDFGPEFRRVEGLEHRAGVLTQGSVLTLTSYPDRTSPVKRGEWVLSVLLGDAPPPPPPTTPDLEQTAKKNPNLSFRETLELHRTDPGCASCHRTMDAVGFSLENFDAVGRWRTEDQGRPVDSAGMLPDGTPINNPGELTRVLVGRRDEFARHLTEKMMTFALGRGVEWTDRCAVDEVLEKIEEDDRFSTLIVEIVNSAPFQSRSVPAAGAAEKKPSSQ